MNLPLLIIHKKAIILSVKTKYNGFRNIGGIYAQNRSNRNTGF